MKDMSMRLASHKGPGPSLSKRASVSSSAQPDLFQRVAQTPATPVDLDIGLELVASIKQALRLARQQGLSVERVCDAMNETLPAKKQVSPRQLYSWCALSREEHRFPGEYLASFCFATRCDAPLRLLANAIGLNLVDEREQVAKELGENLIKRARLAREERQLKHRLGE